MELKLLSDFLWVFKILFSDVFLKCWILEYLQLFVDLNFFQMTLKCIVFFVNMWSFSESFDTAFFMMSVVV